MMRKRRFRLGRGALAIALIGLAATAQSPGPPERPTLDQVFERLRENYVEYPASLPNLFCNEKVRSAHGMYEAVVMPSGTVTESTFRLQRRVGQDGKPLLAESRQVKKVDGKVSVGGSLSGPSILSGVFGSSLGFIAKDQQSCMVFNLNPAESHRARNRIEIEFKPLHAKERPASCGERRWRGKAFLDRETMHLARIEMSTADYQIMPEIRGDWNWEADYGPVLLAGMPFWLPTTIKSQAISYEVHPQEWTFTAEYRNYHKMAASGRIVPGTVVEPPEAP